MHEEIFKKWFQEHRGLIYRIARTYTNGPQDVEDLCQEILLQLWISIPRFKGNCKEITWIYRVALNTAIVWFRNRKRKFKKSREILLDFKDLSDVQKNPSQPDSNVLILEQLYEAIRKLPKEDSSIVLMYLDGLSYDEMAEVIGISRGNIGVRLSRAKKQLSLLLKGLIDDI